MIFAAWKRESDSNLANCIGSPLSGPQSITVAVKTSLKSRQSNQSIKAACTRRLVTHKSGADLRYDQSH
jgi:hypothetical protein